MKRNRIESKQQRVARVRELYLLEGMDADAIERLLRKEKLLSSRRRDSALRLIRGDMAEIDETLRKAATAEPFPELALARWIERNERLYSRLVEELERFEGTTTSETVFIYPGGKKGKSITTTKGDPGGQRIRAAALAMEAARNIAEAHGAAIKRTGDPAGDRDQPPFLGVVIGLEQVSPEARAKINAWQQAAEAAQKEGKDDNEESETLN